MDYVATSAQGARDACAVLGWNSFQKSALNGRNSCKEQLILVKKKKKEQLIVETTIDNKNKSYSTNQPLAVLLQQEIELKIERKN